MDKKQIAEKIYETLSKKNALRITFPLHIDKDKFRFMVVDDIVQVLESCEKPYCEDCHGTGKTGVYSLGKGWRDVPCESCKEPTFSSNKEKA